MEKVIINVGDRFVCYADSFKVPYVEKSIEIDEYDDTRLRYVDEIPYVKLSYEDALDVCYSKLDIYFREDLAFEFEYMGKGKVKEMSTGKLFSICSRDREWGLCDVEDYSNIPNYYGHSCKDEGIDNYLEFIKENPLTIQPRTDFDVSETPIFGLNDSEAIKELCNKKEEFSDYVEEDDLRRRFIATMEELSKKVSEKTCETVIQAVDSNKVHSSYINL